MPNKVFEVQKLKARLQLLQKIISDVEASCADRVNDYIDVKDKLSSVGENLLQEYKSISRSVDAAKQCLGELESIQLKIADYNSGDCKKFMQEQKETLRLRLSSLLLQEDSIDQLKTQLSDLNSDQLSLVQIANRYKKSENSTDFDQVDEGRKETAMSKVITERFTQLSKLICSAEKELEVVSAEANELAIECTSLQKNIQEIETEQCTTIAQAQELQERLQGLIGCARLKIDLGIAQAKVLAGHLDVTIDELPSEQEVQLVSQAETSVPSNQYPASFWEWSLFLFNLSLKVTLSVCLLLCAFGAFGITSGGLLFTAVSSVAALVLMVDSLRDISHLLSMSCFNKVSLSSSKVLPESEPLLQKF